MLSSRVWVLAERLSLHVYDAESFVKLLKSHEIEYPVESYKKSEITKMDINS
jgi:hypothetical protein